jgi:SAM-dependent methyltransferase
MVEATAKRFPELRDGRLRVADARNLSGYASSVFDVVLFSYNGIDYISPEDRLRALREMVRVTATGGTIAFSSHNLRCAIPKVFDFNREDGIRYGVRRTLTRLRFESANPTLRWTRHRKDAMWVRDPAHGFGLQTLYVDPAAQVRQIEALGLTDVTLYGQDGQIVKGETTSPGVYYSARKH